MTTNNQLKNYLSILYIEVRDGKYTINERNGVYDDDNDEHDDCVSFLFYFYYFYTFWLLYLYIPIPLVANRNKGWAEFLIVSEIY